MLPIPTESGRSCTEYLDLFLFHFHHGTISLDPGPTGEVFPQACARWCGRHLQGPVPLRPGEGRLPAGLPQDGPGRRLQGQEVPRHHQGGAALQCLCRPHQQHW